MGMPIHRVDGFKCGETRDVGIDVGGEPEIGMSQELLCGAYRHPLMSELCREGVAEGVKAEFPNEAIDPSETICCDVLVDAAGVMNPVLNGSDSLESASLTSLRNGVVHSILGMRRR